MRPVKHIALALAISLAAAAPAAGAAKRPLDKPDLARAKASYVAMQKYLYVKSRRLYRGSPYSHVWPFSQALAATVAVASLPKIGRHYSRDVLERLDGLDAYWDASKQPPGYDGSVVPPLGRGGDIGYDDNEWIALELIRRYQHSAYQPLLARAQQLFTLVTFGWDNDPTHPCPGGVVFSQDPDNVDRNTVSNAPGVELGMRLYQITGDRQYLDWATRMYNWVETCMRTQAGLFQDHITFDGEVDRTIWSYNQGTMIGSNVLLWKATGQKSYLRRAKAGAAAALSYFTPGRLRAQPPFFVSIFADNLMMLDSVRPNSAYRRAIAQYAGWAWRKVRNRKSGVFAFHTDGGQVLEQAAMVRIYATLAGAALIG